MERRAFLASLLGASVPLPVPAEEWIFAKPVTRQMITSDEEGLFTELSARLFFRSMIDLVDRHYEGLRPGPYGVGFRDVWLDPRKAAIPFNPNFPVVSLRPTYLLK